MRSLIFYFVFFVIPLQIYGDYYLYDSPLPCIEESCYATTYSASFQGRISAYFPLERKITRIYSTAFAFYEGEFDLPLWCNISSYFSAGYLENTGHSHGLHNRTKLEMVPFALGLKYYKGICSYLDYYIGAGVTYSLLYMHDDSPYVKHHISKSSVGGTAKFGIIYFFCENWLFDLSVDYLYQRFSFRKSHSRNNVERHDLDMSGIKLGASVGYAF